MLYFTAQVLITIGAFFIISGIFGLIKFPDTFSKLHATSVTEVVGIPLVLIGLALIQNNVISGLKILLLIPVIWIIGPLASHAIAKAAYDSESSQEGK